MQELGYSPALYPECSIFTDSCNPCNNHTHRHCRVRCMFSIQKHDLLKLSSIITIINSSKWTCHYRRPQTWMSMTRTVKARLSPAGSVASTLKRQSEAMHSSSSYQHSFQQPHSEASSSTDTVETAQLAPVPRQPQLAFNTRLPHSEGLFGRCNHWPCDFED